jgi:hypothetical protein
LSKLISGLVFIYLILTLLAGFINGQGGINETILTKDMTIADTDCEVQSTGGFLNEDKITIDNEVMTYTSINLNHFYGLDRKDPKAHKKIHADLSPTIVYCQQTSLLNNALGFNASSVTSNAGGYSLLLLPIKFFTTTLPNLIRGSNTLIFFPGELAFIGYIWIAITIGIVISLGISLIWVASNIISKII